MYLKSLDMLGFKSFAEAKIQFPKGITAIVGPNGSGKSNVVDAILWVLGEQSTKTLRSERMEDVIFNGTEVRKPVGLVEVSLVIGGLGELRLEGISGLPSQLSEYQELMITRRLYRNGDSEYLINKTACRLKDIRSVLIETRAGSKGHTVIEQGRIEQILQASPQDRRELIEETAGIVRYKKQKGEALRKLESTQQNLLRVRDIVAEVKKQLNSLERQARQARSYQTLQQEARGLEIELLSRDYRAMRTDLETVEREAREVESHETEQMAEQARLDSEQESIRLRMNDAAEAISQVREQLTAIEQRQSQALTAAEVERNRTELFERQRVQAAQEMDRLAADREQARTEIEELRGMSLQLEGDIAQQEKRFQELDAEAKSLSGHRAAAVAEEERARRDVLNLAVLVGNTEQSLEQVTARRQETVARSERVSRERESLVEQVAGLDEQRHLLSAQREEAAQRIQDLMAERRTAIERIEGLGGQIAGLDRDIVRLSEDVAGVESRLGALQGIVREEMGYGREGEEEDTALKACDGVREALAEWLVIPPGLDRAVETILGDRVRGWLVDEPLAGRQAVEFLNGKQLGRGAFFPRQLRWMSDRAVDASASWWPALEGQPGVVGRALDVIQAQEESAPVLGYLFDGIVIVESLTVALHLWQQNQWSAPSGPTCVTLSGEILDAAGVITGGGSGTSGGLLQRRREVLELEARRAEAAQALELTRQARDEASAQSVVAREDEQDLAGAIREAEMLELSLQKDDAGLERQCGELHRRVDLLAEELQRGLAEQTRLQEELQTSQAQLGQWTAEKTGQEACLVQVRERLTAMESQGMAVQQRLTEVRLALESMRGRRDHGISDIARFTQRLDGATQRAIHLEEQAAGLVEALEQSREEQTRQETLCRELGAEADGVKAQLVAAQERQAQEMAGLHAIEESLTAVRQSLSVLHDRRMTAEVRKAEVKAHLSTTESTLIGTYQIDPDMLLASPADDQPVEGDEPLQASASVLETDQLREQIQRIRERLDRMGAINLAAIDEHRELEERYLFLTTQEQDLSASIASLKEIIQRINRTTKDMFVETFNELQQKFREVFAQFFPGGRAELQMVEEPLEEGTDDNGAREPGVEIVAQPPGKRLKSITMLSGGEKTLTAMALLIASFLIRPTPFCILDEIDAPLDEENIGRFTAVLRGLSATAQFLVITHNKRTMAMADSLFGVTMEEPGVSTLISVKLGDLQPA
ncbi:MAG: putative Chromosome segregation protein Smc [Nitrospira sp.]|nr:putative Chromosome segregation protein Smc [Nitrospira sp.]